MSEVAPPLEIGILPEPIVLRGDCGGVLRLVGSGSCLRHSMSILPLPMDSDRTGPRRHLFAESLLLETSQITPSIASNFGPSKRLLEPQEATSLSVAETCLCSCRQQMARDLNTTKAAVILVDIMRVGEELSVDQ